MIGMRTIRFTRAIASCISLGWCLAVSQLGAQEQPPAVSSARKRLPFCHDPKHRLEGAFRGK